MSKEIKMSLKFGGLKSYDADVFTSNEARLSLKKYHEAEDGSLEEKQALCSLIDTANVDEIYIWWDGNFVSKKAAKEYVMNYETNTK